MTKSPHAVFAKAPKCGKSVHFMPQIETSFCFIRRFAPTFFSSRMQEEFCATVYVNLACLNLYSTFTIRALGFGYVIWYSWI